MSLKRKILFLMPSLRGGGAERTLINLLHRLDYERYDIDLIVVSKTGPYITRVPEDVNVTYLFKSDLLVRSMAFLHRTFGFDWFFRAKMEKITKQYDVGISYLDSNFTDLLFFKENISSRIAFIHSSYQTHDNYERFYKYKRIRKRLNRDRYSKLDGIVFVSKDSKSEFVELFGEQPNMDVVYNLIDKESVLNKSNMNKNRWTSDTFTFCAVGSLMPVKGFDRLIRAAKIVYERGYDFRIVIAGTGNEGKKLKEIVSSLELTNCIIFVGFLENPYPLMKSSDVFVMSSVSEALPTVLCEAMILGLPCLVTNASGCRGLVNSGEFGMMAEQDDTDLANKMILFMEKPGLVEEYSQKALERSKLFDDESVLHNYYKIFDGKYSGN